MVFELIDNDIDINDKWPVPFPDTSAHSAVDNEL